MWGEPNVFPNKNNRMDPTDRKDFLKLKDMKVPPQKSLIIEMVLYDAEFGPMPFVGICSVCSFGFSFLRSVFNINLILLIDFVGMHLLAGLFEDEVCRFATQKRVASDAGSSRTTKKSRSSILSMLYR